MVEDDTYHVKLQPRDPANTVAHSLITKERTQKLDLLIHLLSNLTQALVVCGPAGIGKTTLLKILQERKTESWRYSLIQGNAYLSFEAIQELLAQTYGKPGQSLSMALGLYEGQHKQIVLIVDNAGELVPGLITAIAQYAAANPVLRVVLALTHDELQMKRGSDRVMDDCHIVEIPPLSEKQCGDFLQYLSTKPYANLSFNAISENMIAHIYRETHGIPGRIIAEVSGLPSVKQGGKLKWMIAVAAACAIAVGVLELSSSKNNDKKVISPVAVEHKADDIAVAPHVPESKITLALPPAQPVIQQQSVLTKEGNLESLLEPNVPTDEQQSVISAAKSEAVSSIDIKPQPENKASDGAAQNIAEALEDKQEKPKQPEISKDANVVATPIPENLKIKTPSGPMSAVESKPNNKQADAAPQKINESPAGPREKPKRVELVKSVHSVESLQSNNLETIQIPQKPVEIAAVPEGRVAETVAPQQVVSDGSTAQSANNFTLQLMVLSKQSSVDAMLNKYPAMGSDFRAIKTIAQGKDKYILVYGSYPDMASANKAKQSLPPEFRKALVRKVSSVEHR